MNELTPTKAVRPVGATAKDSSALRGLCASLNAGFIAPGGADAATQKEIAAAMRGDSTFKQPSPPARINMPARQTASAGEQATIPPTSLPTQEARAQTLVHRPEHELPITTGGETDEDTPALTDCEVQPETEERPAPPATNDGTVNPKYQRVVFTGQMKAGKDYCAAAGGYRILSLAAPLYALLKFFFGIDESQKDLPGARKFMQDVGTWGRGDVTQTCALTPERAMFTRMIHALAAADQLPMAAVVDWESFGADKDIWLKACLKQGELLLQNPYAKVAVVNARFENEIKAFDDAGWARFHVMASPLALKQRRDKDNVPLATLKHESESLAAALDKGSVAMAGRTKKPKINVIWNDPAAGRPSSKFYTLKEFVAAIHQHEH